MYGISDNEFQAFPNPFATFSRSFYPRTMREVFDWSEYLWNHFGVYSQAIRNSVRYFLTEVEILGNKENPVDYDTRKKYEQFLMDNFNILDVLANIGDDLMGFGNSFTSIYVPVNRTLECPHCHYIQPIGKVDFRFEDFVFKADCSGCSARNARMIRRDGVYSGDGTNIKIVRYNPKNILVDHCPVSGRSEYYYDPPEDMRRRVKEGDKLWLTELPWEMVEAVQKNQVFKFNDEFFKHLKNDVCAATMPTLRGWGLPPFMNEFEQVVYLQILNRFNEAIALDYLIPFRAITPPPATAGTDPLRSHNMGQFMSAVKSMIKEHRLDPTTWHTLPFPAQYQAFGAEAKNLVPVDLINNAMDSLLTSMGIPTEFYKGTLSQQAAPINLRMFEKIWGHYVCQLNQWINWFLKICARLLMWESVNGRLVKSSIYEDDEIRKVKMDLSAANQISRHTAFKAIAVDPDYERERMMEESAQDAKRQAEEGKKQQVAQQLEEQLTTPPPMTLQTAQQQMAQQGPGGPPPGASGAQAAPPPSGGGQGAPVGGPGTTVDEIVAQAEQLAQQIMGMDATTRRQQLINLKKQNPQLHAQVKQNLENMEQQAGMQGKVQARQQAAGGGAPQ